MLRDAVCRTHRYNNELERNMTELEFKSLATQGYNRIPLIAEAFADLETPRPCI